jgi:predicted aspartyl protease
VESHQDLPEGVLTATDWFEKGKNMDDESEAEIECYQKALALEPEFAPAHYRLGAIYYRQANYELADEAFADFLKYASEEDKQAYSIYVYYSPSDIARLSPKKEEEPVIAEEEGSGDEDYPEEKEALSEEASESEGEAETEETGGEEETENVLTIVRFLPVDGHIMVPVVMNDRVEAKVLVDTGSSITVVSRELAERLRLHEEPGHGITLKTMAMDVQADLARLDSIQLGDLRHKNFRVAVADLALGEAKAFDGILGMDFMQKYRIDIDNVNRTIVFGSGR